MTEISDRPTSDWPTSGAPIDHSDPIALIALTILDHLNGEHADVALLLVRGLGGHPSATSASTVGVDRFGLDIRADDHEAVRIPFPEAVTDVASIMAGAMTLIAAAKGQLGEDAPTSLERQEEAMSAIRTFFTTVVRTEQRSPHLRRITFGGGDLTTFAPLSPDQFMYVLLPPKGETELSIDATFTWESYRQMAAERQPQGAYYTVRHHRPDVAEIDMDFVLHGDEGAASSWAARAQAGDPVALWGPRTGFEPPVDTDSYLLVADETGLPGLGAIVDSLPEGTAIRAIIEVADESERQPLRESPTVQVTWLHRDGADAGTTTRLVDTIRGVDLPAGTWYAWGGGESRAMTQVRRHLRTERAMAREAVSMIGYWRHSTTTDHAADDD